MTSIGRLISVIEAFFSEMRDGEARHQETKKLVAIEIKHELR